MSPEKEIAYSALPVPTWRWLGVNEVRVPEGDLREPSSIHLITVPAGESRSVTLVFRGREKCDLRVELGAGAELRLSRVQLAGAEVSRADTVKASLAENARLIYTAVELGGARSASVFEGELVGDGSSADVAAVYFADGEQRLDMNYVLRQRGKNTLGIMDIHGVLSGRAEKLFRGTLDFVRGAAGAAGREQEEVVLLSPHVINRSAPLMLSGEAEVEGHHALSVGKLDEDKLFYLMSRGLSSAEAKRLVTWAAAAPVLERLEDEGLRQEIRGLLEGRITDG